MNQRTTGLVVGLVIFVILTVGLLASTIYFNIEMNDAKVKAKESSDTARAAQGASRRARRCRDARLQRHARRRVAMDLTGGVPR